MNYYNKYIKYKKMYLNLKCQIGGQISIINNEKFKSVTNSIEENYVTAIYDASYYPYTFDVVYKEFKNSNYYKFNIKIDANHNYTYEMDNDRILSDYEKGIVKYTIEKLFQIMPLDIVKEIENILEKNISWYAITKSQERIIKKEDILTGPPKAEPLPEYWKSNYDVNKKMDKIEEIFKTGDVIKICGGYIFSSQSILDKIYYQILKYEPVITVSQWKKIEDDLKYSYFFIFDYNNKIFFINKDLELNTVYGHPNVGTSKYIDNNEYTYNLFGNGYIYKELDNIKKENYTIILSSLLREIKFIKKCNDLSEKVNQVVYIPNIIIINYSNDNIIIGYLMSKIKGITVRDLYNNDKKTFIKDIDKIIEKTITALRNMSENGYNINDFELDNIMWDGQFLTVIDITETSFRLKDTSGILNVMYMLNSYKQAALESLKQNNLMK